MHSSFTRGLLGAALAVSLLGTTVASATVIVGMPNVDFSGGSTTFGYLGQSFTLTDNGSGFPSPVSASTSGTAMYATDFAGISVYFDPPRNTLVFDGSPFYNYTSYPTPAVLAFSSFPTIIGLALTGSDGVHYGYAELVGTTLQQYGFETVPGVGIAALAQAIPEPSGVALLGLGTLGLVFARRRRNATA